MGPFKQIDVCPSVCDIYSVDVCVAGKIRLYFSTQSVENEKTSRPSVDYITNITLTINRHATYVLNNASSSNNALGNLGTPTTREIFSFKESLQKVDLHFN